jgi:hypothetical protein
MANQDSEAYNEGWLTGNASFIKQVHDGFKGEIPQFVADILGTPTAIREAIKRDDNYDPLAMADDDGDISWDDEMNFQGGEDDGYDETADEIFEAYKTKGEPMPAWLGEMVGEE